VTTTVDSAYYTAWLGKGDFMNKLALGIFAAFFIISLAYGDAKSLGNYYVTSDRLDSLIDHLLTL
jgi:hypothetical protein